MKIERSDQVVVITMQRTENRFNPEHLGELEDALDQVAAMEGRPAAVLTGEDKFFSNGLDLEWMGTVEPSDAKESVERTMRLFARIRDDDGAIELGARKRGLLELRVQPTEVLQDRAQRRMAIAECLLCDLLRAHVRDRRVG